MVRTGFGLPAHLALFNFEREARPGGIASLRPGFPIGPDRSKVAIEYGLNPPGSIRWLRSPKEYRSARFSQQISQHPRSISGNQLTAHLFTQPMQQSGELLIGPQPVFV